MGLIDTINSPDDLKRLPRAKLNEVAAELRKCIVDVVSRNGGHLASSLGAVELAIAIHYVFDTPRDRVIWDVGHQAYAHKLLTGRREAFSSLRQHGGLSGFTRRSESPYDSFSTGHSSTSISAGFGMACAKFLKQDESRTIAVIGDGSLTAGMAFEGLNQAGGNPKRDLIVILNDNEMSISRNVGALSSFLSRTFSAKKLQEMRKELGFFFKSLPRIGADIYQLAKRTEESFKAFVTPGMLFEAFNFEYFGPINGHKIDHLIDILNNVKYIREPVLLHVTTTKGKGYLPAEKNPVYFHGCPSFDIGTGTCRVSPPAVPSYTEVFGRTLLEMAAQDPRVVAVTAAMPEGTGLAKFAEAYPDRFFDVGIAEQHAVTFAAGMATEGFRPFVAIYSTFLQRAYDQILHDVCLERLPVTLALDRGGLVGEDGPTHHGIFDLAYLRSLPNMVVMAPRNENELRRMMATCLQHDGPVAFRYPRGSATGCAVDADPCAGPARPGQGADRRGRRGHPGDRRLRVRGPRRARAAESAGGLRDGRGCPLREAPGHHPADRSRAAHPAPRHGRGKRPAGRVRERRARSAERCRDPARGGAPHRHPRHLRGARRPAPAALEIRPRRGGDRAGRPPSAPAGSGADPQHPDPAGLKQGTRHGWDPLVNAWTFCSRSAD